MIKVLIVEDSPALRDMMVNILNEDDRFTIIATASDGVEAVDLASSLRPDVIAMDVHLPKLNGFEATRRIMSSHPCPIVIVSEDYNPADSNDAFRALQAGAVALIEKPRPSAAENLETIANQLKHTLMLMSEVKVVRRLQRTSKRLEAEGGHVPDRPIKIIAIGASTGGPQIIEKILAGLPRDFKIPILITQHITTGFMGGFVSWLNMTSAIPVVEASHDILPADGTCYVAPDNHHLVLGDDFRLKLAGSPPEHSAKPSISVLMRSIARVCPESAVGILLSGMGKDGACELGYLRQRGGITIVQDQASSLIFGIPGEAVRMNAAKYIFAPDQIIRFLIDLHTNLFIKL